MLAWERLKTTRSGVLKAYSTDIEEILSTFEQATEWPDLVKSLQKLNGILDKYKGLHGKNKSSGRIIPSAVTLTKRLAQCLNDGLPGGVHLKTLETYETIFKLIGKRNLTVDLSLYCAGIFPLLSYASTKIKSKLLDVYENFFLPLGSNLAPALNGFVLALIPGLEEPHTNLFSRVVNMMDKVLTSINHEQFVGTIWMTLLHCPQARLGISNYLLHTFDDLNTSSNIVQWFIPENPTICVQALLSAVYDQNLIVQRNTLDLIIRHYPLVSTNLYETLYFNQDQLEILVSGLLPVLLVKEQQINRRVYQHLLGSGKDNRKKILKNENKNLLYQIYNK